MSVQICALVFMTPYIKVSACLCVGTAPRTHNCQPASQPASSLTFLGHPDLKALLQAAVLAAVACDLVDLTVLVAVAGVHHVLLDAAPKETL